MGSEVRRTIEARYIAPIALLVWVVGYLHGYAVGEREGHDSSAEDLGYVYDVGLQHGRQGFREMANGG